MEKPAEKNEDSPLAQSALELLGQIEARRGQVREQRGQIASAAASTLERLLPQRAALRKKIQSEGGTDQEKDSYRKICYSIALLEKTQAHAHVL